MDDIFIIFSSSTTANKVKRLALREGIRGLRVIQTPKVLSKGCSYALQCGKSSVDDVCAIATEYGMDASRRYREYLDDEGNKCYEML